MANTNETRSRRYCITNEDAGRVRIKNETGREWFTLPEARAMVSDLKRRGYSLLLWKQVSP
jgi:hypothetical protein